MFKLLTSDKNKLKNQRAKCQQMWSWKDCTSQKLQESVQLQTLLALYEQETVRNNGQTSYVIHDSRRLKYFILIRWWELEILRVLSDVVERGSVTKSRKRKKAYAEIKVWECFQWKAHGQYSKGDSCGFSHDTTASGNSGCGQRRKGRSSSPAPNSKAKTDGQEGNRDESSDKKKSDSVPIQKIIKTRDVNFGIFPCVRITGLSLDAQTAINADIDTLRQGKRPAKSQLQYWRSLHIWVVYLKILIRENQSIPLKQGKLDQNTPSNFLKALGTK